MNEPCPHCGSTKTHKHGDRRRYCPACDKAFVVGEHRHAGRKPIGDRPMTAYERLKRYLDKKKKKQDTP